MLFTLAMQIVRLYAELEVIDPCKVSPYAEMLEEQYRWQIAQRQYWFGFILGIPKHQAQNNA